MKKLFFLAAMCCLVMNTWADGTQKIVTTATMTNWNNPTYGFNVSNLSQLFRDVVLEAGAVYHLEAHMSDLYRVGEGGTLTRLNSGVLKEGTYCAQCQIRIDGDSAAFYRLPRSVEDSMVVTIDGHKWSYSAGYSGPTYSFANIMSPNFVVTKVDTAFQYVGGQISFYKLQKGSAITENNMADYVFGGTGIYAYSKKTNHITWLTLSAAGVISGTPDAVCLTELYDTLTISDGAATPIDVRVCVSRVAPAPAEREIITSAIFTNMPTLEFGSVLHSNSDVAKLVAEENAHYTFGSGVFWYKYNEDESKWVRVYDGTTATEGRYRLEAQLRVDATNDNGLFYRLPNDTADFTFTIDGVKCIATSAHYISNTYSYGFYVTPEVVVSKTTAIDENENENQNENVRKVMHNGQLLILRDGKTYNALGGRME